MYNKYFNSAFSLVELMISLITISLVFAAFAPVITKKLTKNTLTIASSGNASNTIECNSTCATCSTSIDNCTSCKGGYYLNNNNCVTCPLNAICSGGITDFICEQYYTKDNDRCKRTLCPTGEYLSDETCLKCPENGVCNGVNALCAEGYVLNNGTCVIAHDLPTCEDSSVCSFDGNINGDWMLTIKGSTRVNFKTEEEVDIFAVGGGAGGGGSGRGTGGSGGYTNTVKNVKVAGSYIVTIGQGGRTNLNKRTAGTSSTFGSLISADGGKRSCDYWSVKSGCGGANAGGGSGGGSLPGG